MKQKEKDTGIVILRGLSYIFVIWMIGICPLFMRNKFYDIAAAKVDFIRVSSIVFIVLILIMEVIRRWFWKEKIVFNKKITPEIIFAGMLLTAAGISAIAGGNLAESFWGPSGRRFGMFMLLLYIVVYFIIGRYLKANTGLIWIFLVANTLVFLIGILNFWGVDPLGTYDRAYNIFIGTIGNINIYSSYICLIVPAGMVLYYLCDMGFSKIIYTVFLITGFYSAYATNTDSWILGIGAGFFVLLWFALKDTQSMKKYYCLCGIFWFSSVLVKISMIAGNILGTTSNFVYAFSNLKLQNIMINEYVLLAEAILLLVLLIVNKGAEKEKIKICYSKWRKIIFAGIAVCFLGFLVLVIAVNIWAEWGVKAGLGMLQLTDGFGSSRGYIWKSTISIFKEQPLIKQIFGCGMNCFWEGMPVKYQNEMMQYFGARLLDAHNEFLQYLATAGIVGAIGYFGFLIRHIYLWWKKAAENPLLIIGVVTVCSYLVQGLVNNPSVFVTACLFIFVGIMKSIERT